MKIPRPKRGTCPSCGHNVALRGDGRVRKHARIRGFGLTPLRDPCPGAGLEPGLRVGQS